MSVRINGDRIAVDYYQEMLAIQRGNHLRKPVTQDTKQYFWVKYLTDQVFALVDRRDRNLFDFTFTSYREAYEYAKQYTRNNPHWTFAYL